MRRVQGSPTKYLGRLAIMVLDERVMFPWPNQRFRSVLVESFDCWYRMKRKWIIKNQNNVTNSWLIKNEIWRKRSICLLELKECRELRSLVSSGTLNRAMASDQRLGGNGEVVNTGEPGTLGKYLCSSTGYGLAWMRMDGALGDKRSRESQGIAGGLHTPTPA